jgi:hypothetical protein
MAGRMSRVGVAGVTLTGLGGMSRMLTEAAGVTGERQARSDPEQQRDDRGHQPMQHRPSV